jgi:hypothetical protein
MSCHTAGAMLTLEASCVLRVTECVHNTRTHDALTDIHFSGTPSL